MGEVERLIPPGQSLGIALNVPALGIPNIVESTHDIAGVSSYVLSGMRLGPIAIQQVVAYIKEISPDKKIIYDHQKGGLCEPELAPGFVDDMKEIGVDALVIFDFDDPDSLDGWVKAVKDADLHVIFGPYTSEGRYLSDARVFRTIEHAKSLGVSDFWVRGNNPDRVALVRQRLVRIMGEDAFTLHLPKWVDQTGQIDTRTSAGVSFQAVIGRAICNAATDDIRQITQKLAEKITNGSW